MTEATAIPGGAGVSGGGGGNAPALGTITQGGVSNGSQPAAPWYSTAAGLTDEDRAVMEAKGWNKADPIEAYGATLKSYREMEKVFKNRDSAVLLPKMDDPKSRGEFFGKLGKPDAANKYELPASMKGVKVNEKLMGQFQELAHTSDMLPHQFQAMVSGWEKMAQQAEAARTEAFNSDQLLAKQKLEDEYGDKYGEQVARGNLTLHKLNLKESDRDALGHALGAEKATRLLMQVGELLGQHQAHGLSPNTTQDPFVTDKGRAQARISAIKMVTKGSTGQDADFLKALMNPGHPEHKRVDAQWREWQRIANSKQG